MRARAAILERWPQIDRIWITIEQMFRFHEDEFDEMHCKLEPTENPRSFDTHPSFFLPFLVGQTPT